MAQFDIYLNKGKNHASYPYFMDVQNQLLKDLNQRVVIPLTSVTNIEPIKPLHPIIQIDNQDYILLTHLLSSVRLSQLNQTPITNVDYLRNDIIAALDILFSGI